MLERDRLQPVDADVYPVAVIPPRDFEVLASGCPGADEDGVEFPAVKQFLHALDRVAELQVDTHFEDVVDLLVEHFRGQSETRDVSPHQPAGRIELLEDRDLVAERTQVVRDRERRAATADQRHLLAVTLRRRLRQSIRDIVPVIGGDAFQPADRDRLVLDAATPARRLAGSVADAPEDAREYVRLAILHVSIAETTLCY